MLVIKEWKALYRRYWVEKVSTKVELKSRKESWLKNCAFLHLACWQRIWDCLNWSHNELSSSDGKENYARAIPIISLYCPRPGQSPVHSDPGFVLSSPPWLVEEGRSGKWGRSSNTCNICWDNISRDRDELESKRYYVEIKKNGWVGDCLTNLAS